LLDEDEDCFGAWRSGWILCLSRQCWLYNKSGQDSASDMSVWLDSLGNSIISTRFLRSLLLLIQEMNCLSKSHQIVQWPHRCITIAAFSARSKAYGQVFTQRFPCDLPRELKLSDRRSRYPWPHSGHHHNLYVQCRDIGTADSLHEWG
jgi:hypothetical protein